MIEVAADHRQDAGVITAAEINEIARTNGFNISPNNAVVFQPGTQLPPIGEFPAWRRGAEAARILREQQNLGNDMISNARLTQMTGLVSTALGDKTVGPSFSFALINPGQSGQMVFRSKGETGRRFQLARILGDCLAGQGDGLLHPATRSATYRQKMQRSFAAEFLCPFEGLDDMLAGDYSSENIEEASEYYSVSELTVRTLLVNHRRIDRQEIEGDMDLLTAA